MDEKQNIIIGRRLKQLRLAKKLEQQDVANHMGYRSDSTISKWENGKNLPNGGKLTELAILFDTTTDYILHGNEKTTPTTLTEITNTSAKLDEPRQKIVLETAKEQLAKQNKVLQFSVDDKIEEVLEPYKQGVETYSKLAAGIGYSYGADTTTEIMYTDRLDLKAYDYASLVSGDSMEPKFNNGDVVLIQQGYDNINGGIYAVDYDGKAFLKRVYVENGNFIMKSINTKYKDITVPLPIPEGTYLNILGKVVDSFTPIEK